MPATKPANTAEFATSPADPGDVSWPSLKAGAGYSFRDEVPYEEFNGLLNRLGDWTAYLNDLIANVDFNGGSGDYEGPQRDPYSEVAWATNATLVQASDTASDVTVGLTHSGAGTATWAADRLLATDYAQVRTVGIERGDFSSGSGQAITFTDKDTIGTTPAVIHNSIKPDRQDGIGGSSSFIQRDQHLFQENLLKARWRGVLSASGGDLAASSVVSYNMSFINTPGDADTYKWQLAQASSGRLDGHVVVTLHNQNNLVLRTYHATSTGDTDSLLFWDGTNTVAFGIRQLEYSATSGGTVTITDLEDGNNITDEAPQILVTIEVY